MTASAHSDPEAMYTLDTARHHAVQLGATLLCLLAMLVTYLIFVRSARGRQLEALLLPADTNGHVQDTWLLGPAQQLLAVFGNRAVLACLFGTVLLLGFGFHRFVAGFAAIGSMAATLAIGEWLKRTLTRPGFEMTGVSSHNSFPSGHVGLAMAFVLGVLLTVPARARKWLAAPGTLFVASVAGATMIAGWHRLSDALGACLLAAMVCHLAATFLPWHARRQRSNPLGMVAGGIAALATPPTILLLATAAPSGAGLATALCGAALAATSTVASTWLLLRGYDTR